MRQDWGWIGISLVVVLAVTWIVIVVLTGLGYNAFDVNWDFTVTGTLGDSFGVLSSAMAAIAAYFAYGTYRAAQEEGQIAARRAFETSFLNLIERRFDVLEQVRSSVTSYGTGKVSTRVFNGQEAIDRIYVSMRAYLERGEKLGVAYRKTTDGVRGLSSYLRLTYHLVALIDRDLPQKEGQLVDKNSHGYQLIRLLRAQLTDSELVLIAMNCVVGSGYAKFRPLVEKYALLHNITAEDRKIFRVEEFFKITAFGLNEADQLSPGDTPPPEWIEAIYVDDQSNAGPS